MDIKSKLENNNTKIQNNHTSDDGVAETVDGSIEVEEVGFTENKLAITSKNNEQLNSTNIKNITTRKNNIGRSCVSPSGKRKGRVPQRMSIRNLVMMTGISPATIQRILRYGKSLKNETIKLKEQARRNLIPVCTDFERSKTGRLHMPMTNDFVIKVHAAMKENPKLELRSLATLLGLSEFKFRKEFEKKLHFEKLRDANLLRRPSVNIERVKITCPFTVLTDENVNKIRDAVTANPNESVKSLSRKFGISSRSVHIILTDHLGLGKFRERWVPKQVVDEQHERLLQHWKTCKVFPTLNVKRVYTAISANPSIDQRDLAQKLGLSVYTVRRIIKDHLHMERFMERWVSQEVAENHKEKQDDSGNSTNSDV